MGLVKILTNAGSKALGYGKRILKVAPDALLGETSDVIGGAMRHTKGSLFTKGKAGFHALEKHVARQSTKNGNFATRVIKNLKSTPASVAAGYKTAAAAAKAAGKSGILAGVKGAGKALLKKMPLIGAVATVAFEAPNIVRAFKDGGFKAGMKEIGGAGVELGGMAAGAAIGSACCPGIGTAIGAVIGGIVGMFARGKTHSEKKAEEEAAAQAQAQTVQYSKEEVQALKDYGFTDEEVAQLQAEGYTIQDVVAAIEAELKAQEKELAKQEAELLAKQQEQLVNNQNFYDPTQAYQYNNLNAVPPVGFNNPYASYPGANMPNYNYANDIYYQQHFGAYPTVNPFNDYINNQYQYYV